MTKEELELYEELKAKAEAEEVINSVSFEDEVEEFETLKTEEIVYEEKFTIKLEKRRGSELIDVDIKMTSYDLMAIGEIANIFNKSNVEQTEPIDYEPLDTFYDEVVLLFKHNSDEEYVATIKEKLMLLEFVLNKATPSIEAIAATKGNRAERRATAKLSR